MVLLDLNTSWSLLLWYCDLVTSTWSVDSQHCVITRQRVTERDKVCVRWWRWWWWRGYLQPAREVTGQSARPEEWLYSLVLRHTSTLHSSSDTLPTTRHSSIIVRYFAYIDWGFSKEADWLLDKDFICPQRCDVKNSHFACSNRRWCELESVPLTSYDRYFQEFVKLVIVAETIDLSELKEY